MWKDIQTGLSTIYLYSDSIYVPIVFLLQNCFLVIKNFVYIDEILEKKNIT